MADFEQNETQPEKQPAAERPIPETAKRMPGMYVRERVLLACVVLLIALFGFTAFIARQYRRTLHRYADDWFAKGNSSMQAGRNRVAINDFRNALVYKPEDPTFQFHLAQALASAGQEAESHAYLANLLSEDPGSGPINLTLARIAVREKNRSDAMRYYHNAIYGVWESDPLKQRWDVRRELCEYLLDQGDVQEAEPDLIALAQEVPPRDPASQRIAGNLLLRAGLWSRALLQFRAVLANDRRDPDALAGAGRAEFEVGYYADAVNYFNRLPRERRDSPAILPMLQTAQQAQTMNALRPALSASEQARRASKALSVATARILACAMQRGETLSTTASPSGPLQQLYDTAQKNKQLWTARGLSQHSDQIAPVMSLAFQAEAAATKLCGEPQGAEDRALSLIASKVASQPNGANQ
jgi:tetratricopeptide (TPR) repeat protein